MKHRVAIDLALDYKLSNALIESTNTKVRLITRKAYGFQSPDALIALALLTLGSSNPPSQAENDPQIELGWARAGWRIQTAYPDSVFGFYPEPLCDTWWCSPGEFRIGGGAADNLDCGSARRRSVVRRPGVPVPGFTKP